jgi:hypothetical protein
MKNIEKITVQLMYLGCLLIAMACSPDDDGMFGRPDNSMPWLTDNDCGQGFTPISATECVCDPPGVNIGDFRCRGLAENEYYATLEGCLTPLESIISVGDEIYEGAWGRIVSTVYLESPRQGSGPTNIQERQGVRFPVLDSLDGITFELSLTDYFAPQSALPIFRGRMVTGDSIVGYLRYVDPLSYEDVGLDSCAVTYIRKEHL